VLRAADTHSRNACGSRVPDVRRRRGPARPHSVCASINPDWGLEQQILRVEHVDIARHAVLVPNLRQGQLPVGQGDCLRLRAERRGGAGPRTIDAMDLLNDAPHVPADSTPTRIETQAATSSL